MDVLWRFPEFRSSLLCISFLWEDKRARSPGWSAVMEGGWDREKGDGERRGLGFHSYLSPSSAWISPKSLSWATVWIEFYPLLSSPTFQVLTCLCFTFQGGNKRQTVRALGEEWSSRKCRRIFVRWASQGRELHTQKVPSVTERCWTRPYSVTSLVCNQADVHAFVTSVAACPPTSQLHLRWLISSPTFAVFSPP